METEETRMNVQLSDEIIGDKPALEDFVRFCVTEAVRAEREACAKVAEEYEGKLSSWEDTYICDKIAEEIRARKD
jgi:hypothetical protein